MIYNMDYKTPIQIKGNVITVIYTKMDETVAKMVLHYYDTPQFNGTLFAVNCLVNGDDVDIDYRTQYPGYKNYIYYQLNNLYNYPEYVAIEHMNQFDEIWDCSINNIERYPEEAKNKGVFMPLRYIEVQKIEPIDEYRYELCFIGVITPSIAEMLSRLSKYWTNDYCKIKLLNGYPYSELTEEIKDCKYVIDIPRNSNCGFILNHTYIFEALCSGKNVIVEVGYGYDNIYSWLVREYSNIYEVLDIVKEDPVDNSWVFRRWTENNHNYEEFRQYYMGNKYIQKLDL